MTTEDIGESTLLTAEEHQALSHYNSKFTPEQKFEAVMAYYLHNSAKAAAETLDSGILASHITEWKSKAPWWSKILNKCRQLQNEDLEGQMTSVLHSTIDELDKRVRYGDKKLNKDGDLIRVPVSARDLAYIGSMLADKRTQLEGQGSQDTRGIQDKLARIQEQLIETLRDAKTPAGSGNVTITQTIPKSNITEVG